LKKLINGLTVVLDMILFIGSNFIRVMRMPPIEVSRSGYGIGGIRRTDVNDALSLYRKLQNGLPLSLPKRFLYFFFGPRLIFAARSGYRQKLSGVGLYYFTQKDIKENTIHQGFTGVSENLRGKGLGTAIRKTALIHFSRSGLSGVSSRVSASNIASIKSNQNLGFKVQDVYFDNEMKKKRYYMVCRFNEKI